MQRLIIQVYQINTLYLRGKKLKNTSNYGKENRLGQSRCQDKTDG